MQLTRRGAALAALSSLFMGRAHAAAAPDEIKIGHLHASSGPFASISMPTYYGLKLWVDRSNTGGGTLVKPFNKKIPLKLISYDDQSNPATAATLVNQLITQDKVDLLVSEQGSVLTAVAVPIAREHKMFLFDPGGSGAQFFTKDNPYIALLVTPVSTIWPKYAAEYPEHRGGAGWSEDRGSLVRDQRLHRHPGTGVPTVHQGCRQA